MTLARHNLRAFASDEEMLPEIDCSRYLHATVFAQE
jgi:hypothetical protein